MGWLRTDLGPARVCFTDRRGGVSARPYDSLDLSTLAGDDPAAVAENRTRVARHLGLPPPSEWVPIRQVHGVTT
ncbi:MAG TPA: laccase domain-containing protein, partial [Acidimicrobiia bacterium]|nr:laccase domain-containing protein [Acidimicrobiia bacterium]